LVLNHVPAGLPGFSTCALAPRWRALAAPERAPWQRPGGALPPTRMFFDQKVNVD